MTRNVRLLDAVKYYQGEVHQNYAWLTLEDMLTDAQLEAFTRLYRTGSKPSRKQEGFPLNVEYFYQRDSKTGHGERSCQASAIAMVLNYLDPNLIIDDDDYLTDVLCYGDCVSQLSHKGALDAMSIKHQFRMNGREQDLIDLLDKGYPVPIGILHKGLIDAPSGGGHWITLIGYNETEFIAHDPFGCMSLYEGVYLRDWPEDGKNVMYSRELLMKRWLIADDSDGWLWDFSENKIL